MKLKDWEIYNKASKTSSQHEGGEYPLPQMDPSQPLPKYIEEFRRTMNQVERLSPENVELATRILKQFL